jgi:integrase
VGYDQLEYPLPHPHQALSPTRVTSERKPGRYADGNGLYLEVDAPEQHKPPKKRWVLRVVVNGRRRDMGLGGLRTTSLKEARQLAAKYRSLARSGGDPLAERRKEQTPVPTFKEAATKVHTEHKASWRNGKHRDQWLTTLETHVFPKIGDLRIDLIGTPEILRVLKGIWLTKPETARRVRQRIRTVFDWLKTAGFRSGDNPAEGVKRALPAQPRRDGHFKALPYDEVAAFVQKLRDCDAGPIVKLAFEFTVLTACRTKEALGAQWSEVDFDTAVWTIPAARMKGGRDHRIPLVPRCVEILRAAQKLSKGKNIFAGRDGEQPLSNMALLMAVRRIGVDTTVHGLRSSFRDWTAEQTNFPREVCEMALAHSVGSAVEAAYRRGDLFEKRRKLMLAWSSYILTVPSGTVLAMRRSVS